MLPLASMAALAIAGVDGLSVAWEAAVRTEGRSVTLTRTSYEASSTAELEVAPRFALAFDGRATLLAVKYEPQLLFTDANGAGSPDVLHTGAITLTNRLDPEWRLITAASGSYGTIDLLSSAVSASAQTGAAAQPAQPLPEARTLPYVRGDTSLTIAGRFSPRERFSANGGFFATGGSTSEAQRTLPLQYGPRLGASYEWDASRQDVLVSALKVSASGFSFGNTAPTTGQQTGLWVSGAAATETWRHRFDREVDGWVGAGAGGYLVNGTGSVPGSNSETTWLHEASLFPVGEAGIQYAPILKGQRLQLRAMANTGPVVDQLTGAVYRRVDGNGGVDWSPAEGWRLSVHGSGGVVVEGLQSGDWVFTNEIRTAYGVPNAFEIALGVRGTWQGITQVDSTGQTRPTFGQWGVFLSITLAHRERM